MSDVKAHWEGVYTRNSNSAYTWTQTFPAASLELINRLLIEPGDPILDAGGGDSRLAEHLLDRGFTDITVLDISEAALELARKRLGKRADLINWICADIRYWKPERTYALWHDRAVYHFLKQETDLALYHQTLENALQSGAYAIIAAFSHDGPEQCSGLPVQRYSQTGLLHAFEYQFDCIGGLYEDHISPGGHVQKFIYGLFVRRLPGTGPLHALQPFRTFAHIEPEAAQCRLGDKGSCCG